jgi:phosphoserine aminotransferase
MQGGATQQFSMVPMNLLSPGTQGNYILTGHWAERAIEEAKKFGETAVASTSKDRGFRYIPNSHRLSANPAYLYFTSNNTIIGSQFDREPEASGVPLVCDASSDLLSRPLEVSKYGLLFACAQKNLGPAGVTIAIMNKELLRRSPPNLPILLDYNLYASNNSLYNTPTVFAIYVMQEVLKWMKKEGGLKGMAARNEEKAALLYQEIDKDDLYRGFVEPACRSRMNVTFNLPNAELEAAFIKGAAERGLVELKGHRSVGGIRVSLYNACPIDAVRELVRFMADFRKRA